MKNTSSSLPSSTNNAMVRALLPVAAVIILLAFAVYLYRPHWFVLGGMKILWPLNSVLAAMGCFILTRRWISSFDASLLAGIIYGFGPFGLSFVSYHPLAGLSYVAVPWLLCPAVYYKSANTAGMLKTPAVALLSLLPFAAIAGLFWSAAHYWAGPLFLMSKNKLLEPADLWGIITPMLFTSNHFAIGFYHMPLICILMGLFAFALSGKETLLVPVMVGIVLSLMPPICDVPPIVWLGFAALFLSVCSALGIQSLAWAGKADRFWILTCVIAALLLAGCNYLMGLSHPQQTDYRQATLLFLASAAAAGLVFLLTQLNLRLTLLRWLVLFGLCAYDLWVTVPRLVDSLF
jgi:hypothetical protein